VGIAETATAVVAAEIGITGHTVRQMARAVSAKAQAVKRAIGIRRAAKDSEAKAGTKASAAVARAIGIAIATADGVAAKAVTTTAAASTVREKAPSGLAVQIAEASAAIEETVAAIAIAIVHAAVSAANAAVGTIVTAIAMRMRRGRKRNLQSRLLPEWLPAPWARRLLATLAPRQIQRLVPHLDTKAAAARQARTASAESAPVAAVVAGVVDAAAVVAVRGAKAGRAAPVDRKVCSKAAKATIRAAMSMATVRRIVAARPTVIASRGAVTSTAIVRPATATAAIPIAATSRRIRHRASLPIVNRRRANRRLVSLERANPPRASASRTSRGMKSRGRVSVSRRNRGTKSSDLVSLLRLTSVRKALRRRGNSSRPRQPLRKAQDRSSGPTWSGRRARLPAHRAVATNKRSA
jgi:hypothetical protein